MRLTRGSGADTEAEPKSPGESTAPRRVNATTPASNAATLCACLAGSPRSPQGGGATNCEALAGMAELDLKGGKKKKKKSPDPLPRLLRMSPKGDG